MIKITTAGDLLTAIAFSRSALGDVFEKNEKKNNTTAVYKLEWGIQVIRVDSETTGDESAPDLPQLPSQNQVKPKLGYFKVSLLTFPG